MEAADCLKTDFSSQFQQEKEARGVLRSVVSLSDDRTLCCRFFYPRNYSTRPNPKLSHLSCVAFRDVSGRQGGVRSFLPKASANGRQANAGTLSESYSRRCSQKDRDDEPSRVQG